MNRLRMLLSSGTRLGPYEILTQIGAGGMGEVYKAVDPRLGRTIAIKLLPDSSRSVPEAVERFRREARSISLLNHPHIVTIHDIGDSEAGIFIAMELVEGQTIRERMREGMPWPEVVRWGEQVARALATSHQAGIVHRDIKPENIMLRDDGYAKVLDFGLASLAGSVDSLDTVTARLTVPGSLMGTLRYMSPEQARGLEACAASDVFALGIVLYEAATGRHPFAAESALMTVHAIVSGNVHAPRLWKPELPQDFDRLVLAMLDKEAGGRPAAAAVAAVLAGIGDIDRRAEAAPVASLRQQTVGREAERKHLRRALDQAVSGRGSVISIAGEPGIGKSTLAEDFAAEATSVVIARGRCSERLAGTEAYLPILEAMENLLHGVDRQLVAELMRSFAPAWYVQLMSVDAHDSSAARAASEAIVSSQERVKRELSAFVHELGKQRPLVIFLDDMHWADASTVDILSYLAGRISSSRVLLLLTYRITDMLLSKPPMLRLKNDLQARGICRELLLDFLSREDIENYLALQFPGNRFGPRVAAMIHAKTEGNALFMADLVRYLRDREVIARQGETWVAAKDLSEVEHDLPESVRAMIEQRLAQLTPEHMRLLGAASVQGDMFDTAVVADVLDADPADVEERLEELERVLRFVRLVEETELPDRVLTLRYRFVHILYQQALQASLRPTRRAGLSRSIAEALLRHHGPNPEAIANDLAVLFETGRDFQRAAEFYQVAARHASRVFASQEAVVLARRGLAATRSSPAGTARDRVELSLSVTLGNALIGTAGYAAPAVAEAFQRARALGEALQDTSTLLSVLYGQWANKFVAGEIPRSPELNRFLEEADGNPDALLVGYRMAGWDALCGGAPLAARDYFDRAIAIFRPDRHRHLAFSFGHEPGQGAHICQAMTLWLLGDCEGAEKHCAIGLRLANEVQHANSRGYALTFAGTYASFRREPERILEYAEAARALSLDQGMAMWNAWAMLHRAFALVELGRMAELTEDLRTTLDALLSTGAGMLLTLHLGNLADVHRKLGQFDRSQEVLEEAFREVEHHGERFWLAELHRLQGELHFANGGDRDQAGHAFRRGLEIAREQGAKSLESRAALSLARLKAKSESLR